MIKSRKDVIRILKANGYTLISSNKHDKWYNGNNSIVIPQKHKAFHVISHKQILKRAGLI